MHPTQHHILAVLKQQDERRYRDLLPEGMDGNTFMHHLRAVMNEGLVHQFDTTYALTVAGKKYVDSWSMTTLAPVEQPKIMVEVAYKNEKGEWLFLEQIPEPFKGKIGFPCGKLLFGERVADAALRKLKEQTGLEALKLDYYGSMMVENKMGETTLTHLTTHIFRAHTVRGELLDKSATGIPLFIKEEALSKYDTFPNLGLVLQRLAGGPLPDHYFTDVVLDYGS